MQDLKHSEGDEIVFHITKNAQQYEPNITLATSPNDKPVQNPITFEDIKLVSSLQASADGHYQSVRMICSGCKRKVNSVIKRRAGLQTFIAGVLLIFCSFGFICVTCIPCMVDDCKDVQHSCPNCKQILGKAQFNILD
ncbi:unnamed protein product (macronuclear) [Paramecium tetraurelia]|uniref:LITAF domain-containing protein n=1 Tax=Paramecium tetraurelia TaxID=5888 RepID=A0C2H1_PARTE|nr:uncharacterized protein GSPATT00034466001 [Paramecium tetraurelia]CAK64988.1 unnamed protein product [Paramecium tetraurelia]|eukprot:XP_001432385.1 hypothetical protein (macronuclear) [Paramecium tetraurelia strain d4-2]